MTGDSIRDIITALCGIGLAAFVIGQLGRRP
jgi:hypothetical protein